MTVTAKNQLPAPCEVVTALALAWFGVGREALGLWAELLKGDTMRVRRRS